jgi:hypothetical protein
MARQLYRRLQPEALQLCQALLAGSKVSVPA